VLIKETHSPFEHVLTTETRAAICMTTVWEYHRSSHQLISAKK